MSTPSGVRGRILFHGNPWPEGHRIENLEWSGEIIPGWGLSLGFVVESAKYYEVDGVQKDPPGAVVDDWTSKVAWSNYHRAAIYPSNTHDRSGIRVSDGSAPFVFGAPSYRFRADVPPIDWETFWETQAFGIYLQGHDAAADHDIALTRAADGRYALRWTGRIARTYVGEYTLDHSFELSAEGVAFGAISLEYCEPKTARERLGLELDPRLGLEDHLARYVAAPGDFEIERRHGKPFAVLHGGRADP